MARARAVIAADPRFFGRGRFREISVPAGRGWMVSADVKLFSAAFAAGFLFVSILIA